MNDEKVCSKDVKEKGKEHAFYDTNMAIIRAELPHWELYAEPLPNTSFKGMWE